MLTQVRINNFKNLSNFEFKPAVANLLLAQLP